MGRIRKPQPLKHPEYNINNLKQTYLDLKTYHKKMLERWRKYLNIIQKDDIGKSYKILPSKYYNSLVYNFNIDRRSWFDIPEAQERIYFHNYYVELYDKKINFFSKFT